MRPRHPEAAAYFVAGTVLFALLWIGADLIFAVTQAMTVDNAAGQALHDSLAHPAADPAAKVSPMGAAGAADPVRFPRFAPPPRDEIREPLFDFVIRIVAADSLGVWSADQIQAHVEALDRPSRLPLDRLVSVERRAVPTDQYETVRGLTSSRCWIMTLDQDRDFPMPYAILGYHPGTLSVSRELEYSEWRLGDQLLRVGDRDDPELHVMKDVTVIKMERGHLVLDVDAWLDELLGKGLDDTWTTGFVLTRGDDGWLGMGLGRGRKGRRLYGAFDFASDKVLPHGRPIDNGLSRTCRPFTRSPADSPNRPWAWDR